MRLVLCSAATLLLLSGCTEDVQEQEGPELARAEAPLGDESNDIAANPGVISLSETQIAAAGIQLIRPTKGNVAGALDMPAVISADPARTVAVAPSVSGRVVSLTRNLGEPVSRGALLALIESREGAELKASLQAAENRLALAETTFAREERLYRERVTPEQDYLAARAALAEARIALTLAQQRLSAAGGAGGDELNRFEVRSPMAGRVIERRAVLGAVIAADAELYRIADLSEVTVDLLLDPESAARVKAGAPVNVTAPGRQGQGRVAFVSPVLDPQTKQVNAIATLRNAQDTWRVGETVQATVFTEAATGSFAVPVTAIQSIDGEPAIFVRTAEGFEVRHVITGGATGGQVAISSGLTGDELIAATNSYILKAELEKAEAGEDED